MWAGLQMQARPFLPSMSVSGRFRYILGVNYLHTTANLADDRLNDCI